MKLDQIINKVANRIPKPLGIDRDFAILVPLIYVKDELHILYEVRSKKLNTQPGEISFPGGRVEKGETFKDAAIRETMEELNIKRKNINIINSIDYIVMPFNISLYPYVGIIEDINFEDINYSKSEVESIFTVPLKFFLENEPERYNMGISPQIGDDFPYHLINNGKAYDWRTGIYPVFFYRYRDYVIWGMTARMTKNFVDIIKE
ncbi:NUDIX hydrolase [Senegalia massiliensis]|jgi:8-oxo-dGTP pyrophosphatase MutT (NUDIX family)|uniref:NUDIX hydrolase n=1 Tax=Senegalia massiliensis TaxID=1720316 RepID=UPI0010312297|nr:CoA pyrophosphatase [Senegalia massiliensis]